MSTAKVSYRWPSQHAWLEWAVHSGVVSHREIYHAYLKLVSGDQIQDEFQSVMQATGFFTACLEQPCTVCELKIEQGDQQNCAACGNQVHESCAEAYQVTFKGQKAYFLLCDDCLEAGDVDNLLAQAAQKLMDATQSGEPHADPSES